jgi:ribosomal protein S18 acetylase RimI-like enzyme
VQTTPVVARAAASRGDLGAGRALLRALDERARSEQSLRCLWVETQNVSYPAIQFYRRLGFRLCGLDVTLYRPDDPLLLPGEVALFFACDLTHRPMAPAGPVRKAA